MRYRLHLLLSLAALCLSSCDDPNASKAKALQNEIDQLQKNIVESQQTVKRLEVQVQAAREERKKLEDDKIKAAEQKSKAEEELERMKQDFDAYKSRYKVSIRNKIPGLQLGELTINGVAYSKVKVNDMGEVSLKFSHYAGMSTVLLKDLPTEVKDLLALTALHDPLPLRVVVSKVKPKEMDLMSTHKSRQREVDEQLAELRNNMLAAEKESAYAKHLVQASIGKNKTPHPKAVDYAREAELRYHQLVAKEALLEVEKDQLYALYQAELRKLRVSR